MRSYIVKKNLIGVVVSDIPQYRQTDRYRYTRHSVISVQGLIINFYVSHQQPKLINNKVIIKDLKYY